MVLYWAGSGHFHHSQFCWTALLQMVFALMTAQHHQRRTQEHLTHYIFKNVNHIVCINFLLHWVFVAAHQLSLVMESKGYASLVHGLLTVVASLAGEHGLQACGLQQWQYTGSVVGARRLQQLWCMVLVASWHVESSWTRDRTCVPCIGRWILIHCTTREVLIAFLNQCKATANLKKRYTFIHSYTCLSISLCIKSTYYDLFICLQIPTCLSPLLLLQRLLISPLPSTRFNSGVYFYLVFSIFPLFL